MANLVGGFFRSLPGSGSLSRSAINYQAGGATRVSGVLTAIFVALALLSLAPLAKYVPKPALAAILLLTAFRLIDLKRIAYTIRASRSDAAIVIVTAIAGLSFGLDQAILIGIGLSIALFMPRAAKLKVTELIVDEHSVVRARRENEPSNEGFLIYDLEGELFFGVAPELERTFHDIRGRLEDEGVAKLLLRLKRVRNPDFVILEQLEHFLKDVQARGVDVWLAGLRSDLLDALRRLHFDDWFPKEHLLAHGAEDYSATLAAVREIHAALAAKAPTAAASPGEEKLYYLV